MNLKTKAYGRLMGIAKAEGIERFVAGALVVHSDSVLLLKRRSDDFLGGIFELPSGKVEENESLIAALRREIKEETGILALEIKGYLGHFDYRSGSGLQTRQFNFLANASDEKVIISSEHESYAWVDRETVGEYYITCNVRALIDKQFAER